MHVSAYAHGGQRCRLELAMQAVVSLLTRVLETELWFSGRAVCSKLLSQLLRARLQCPCLAYKWLTIHGKFLSALPFSI